MLNTKKLLSKTLSREMGLALLTFFLAFGVTSRSVFGKADHESDDLKPSERKVVPKNSNVAEEGCKINPGDISNFANGESYNFTSVVQLVSNPECTKVGNAISAGEMAMGVKFNRYPFHLDDFSKGYSNLTIDGKRGVESGIQKNMAATLRNNPLSSRELLPILGQLSLLSPKAARSMLAYLITQELISQELDGKQGLIQGRDVATAVDTVSTLKKFGADQPLIIGELAANVEDMATTAQADSLGKVLAGLALAAIEFDEFSPTFNSSANAFKKGVKNSISDYSEDEKGRLLKSGFSVANASTTFNPTIEVGVQDVNEALGLLLEGKALDQTTLKSVWRKVLDVAASSQLYSALAEALALSLTPQVIYLPIQDRQKILACAKLHPTISQVVQEMFLEAFNESRAQLSDRKLKIAQFNERKEKFFDPWISGMLEVDATSIKPEWVKEVLARGMIKDEAIESRFPRFVLSLLNAHENSAKKALLDGGVDSQLASGLTGFRVLWGLSDTYIPALNDWSKRHDEE